MVSATFGPSHIKLLSTRNGKLEVVKKAKRKQASSPPGNELFKKEATVCS
jgi:hypothetical protein